MRDVIDHGFGISAVDSGYLRPQLGAIHLLVENGRVAIIDCGVNLSVPRVLRALEAKGLRAGDVDYVILTHIHLDHAGGAGLLMSKLPNARLTVHPRGARHMIDPRKLIEGTIAVYGERHMREMYGEILPIEAARVIETPHDFCINLAGRELRFYDTPGHARHHVCIHDTRSGHVFTGDTFGLSYRELDDGDRQFVIPTSSPVHFDPVAAHRSVDLIAGLKPGAAYLTHYSRVWEIGRLADDMHRLIDAYVDLAWQCGGPHPDRHARLKQGMTDIVLGEAKRYGWKPDAAAIIDILGGDIDLNAQGLAIWYDGTAAVRT